MPNHLAGSTSPYLLQHADNPVNWYPWGTEALERARIEDRPIFLSIGYAACHWCHVMAHESFEDPATATILNERYVCIKVDREERPDLDSIYMSAVATLTGQGGWPLSVFLTSDLQPFYGGTYFPPTARHGLPAFSEILIALSDAWRDRRDTLIRAGAQVVEHLMEQSAAARATATMDTSILTAATHTLIASYDWDGGGWGAAPKFPQPMAIDFLLRRHLAGDADALEPAVHALRAMARGGMYDVVGGGFARYSTDESWHVPHFEKMLYDNAQLAQTYLHAWQMTGEGLFRRVTEDTLAFVERELLAAAGGFTSSLDADSAGMEGAFYAWTLDEIRSVLGMEADFFGTAYGVTTAGNWDGKTILRRAMNDSALAERYGITEPGVVERLAACHVRLLAARSRRVRPGTDDKVLTAWNGLMLATFAEAARAFGSRSYLNIAVRNADFLLTALRPDGRLHRSWHDGRAGGEVFLDDYASLILGLLELYQTDFDNRWFAAACQLAEQMVRRFTDPAGGFFDTPEGAERLLVRPKDLQDNAVPSGNALTAEALLHLSAFTDRPDWREAAERAIALVTGLCARYPTAFGRWLCAADFALGTVTQVAVVGNLGDERTKRLLAEVRSGWRPNLVVAASPFPLLPGAPVLLAGRPLLEGAPAAYVCKGFVCLQPVARPEDLRSMLDGRNGRNT
jgi:uncharacterized protein YyaL (SSP411 family)